MRKARHIRDPVAVSGGNQRPRIGGAVDAARIAAAVVIAQVFAVYLVVMNFVAPATAHNWDRADPILKLVARQPTLWLVPIASLLTALLWWTRARPGRADLRHAAAQAAMGAAAALVVAGGMRLVAGSHLPSFIPAEESAGPGYLLSMTAGYAEEVGIRMLLLPAIYLLCKRRMPRVAAILVAITVSALAFALWHELGPDPSSAKYFITRTLVPGAAMSAAFFVVGPSFIITAHGAAHLVIPALFL